MPLLSHKEHATCGYAGRDAVRLGPITPERRAEWDEMSEEYVARITAEVKRRQEDGMHYRNGREAKNGDKVVQLSYEGGKVVSFGLLYDAVPGNDYCNGMLAPTHGNTAACLCDCIHVDDLAEIPKQAGLDKRAAGK